MTSISPPVLPPQASSNPSQTIAQAHQSSGSISGKTTPQAVGTAPATARSYANATKKTFSPTSASGTSTSPAVGGLASAQHGKTDSISSVNGKGPIPPAVPAVGTPTIINGNTTATSNPGLGDHSRKPSVTISAAGTSGYIPNGGPAVGKPSGGSAIQFGDLPAGGSPAMANSTPLPNQPSYSLAVNAPTNPRITSPSTSPSPIPQPPASGGRPPSSLQGQSNGLNFGGFGGEETNRQMRPPGMPQGLPTGPQSSHLRRESSQSAHSDLSNQGMNPGAGPNPGRGGYTQAGRGRGFSGQFTTQGQQMGYVAGQNNYRPSPSQQRGGQNIAPPYSQQPRMFPNSPHQTVRSPAPANSQPAHPQPGQIPMGNPQMFPQSFSGYPPHMGMQQNYGYDPNLAAYYQQYGMQMQPSMPPFIPPSSPRPNHQMPHGGQNFYTPGQYNSNSPQPQTMSRTSSAISVSDRPGSSLSKPQTTAPAPSHTPSASRNTNSPAPTKKNDFQIPSRKGGGIVIKDPTTGAIVKPFDKPPASPAPTGQSPAIVSSTPTPPPRVPSSQHQRAESKSVKTDEEKKNDMRDAVVKKLEEEKRLKGEEEAKLAEDKKNAEAKALKEKEDAEARELEAAKAQLEAEEAAKKDKADAEEAANAASKAKEEAEKLKKEQEEEEEFARLEEEMERQEKEAEERYQKKKQAEKEEKARKEAEAALKADEEMKKAEREAEEAEEARLKKLEESESDESHKERVDLFAALKRDGQGFPATETSTVVDTPVESGAATPASDSSMAPPSRTTTTGKQKPAALNLVTTKPVEPAQPSAQLMSLRSARRLMSINDVSYPPSISSPNPALNTSAPMGKFRYDKDFLMQFQRAFVEKPSENWAERVKETVGDTTEPSSARPQSSRTPTTMGARQPSSSRPSIPPAMGSYVAPARPLAPGSTSASRYQESTSRLNQPQRPMQNPLTSFVSPRPGGFPMNKNMERTPSSTSLSSHPQSPRNNLSQRGPSSRGSRGGRAPRESEKDRQSMPLTAGTTLKPIEVTEKGWKPSSVGKSATGMAGPAPGGDGHMAPDVVQRKVKSNLNKMTPQNFEKISDQILAIAGQSKDETDGRTLRQVIQLTFEKATDEAHWAEMYAQFCKRMLEFMSPEIRDESIIDKKGDVVVGGALFRKYLLTRCQTEFERGWKTDLPEKPEGATEEAAMLSDEYYIAAAAKRRGLGLVRFIGELYKLGMLTERIMHECVKKLVDYEGVPDEAEVESLTSLLKTIGENLDANERGHGLMDVYFKRIVQMIETPGLPSRLTFMLMDIVDLRKKNWQGKAGAVKGPTTLDEVRAQAVAAEREKEMQRNADNQSRRGGGGGGGRIPMGRGDARNFSGGGQYGMMPPPEYPKNTVGMDDLRRLSSRAGSRQASSQGNTVFGPTSMFAARGSNTRKPLGPSGIGKGGEESGASSRTATPPAQKDKKEEKDAATQNTFSALAGLDPGEPTDPASPPSTASSPPLAKSKPVVEQRSQSPPKDKSDDKEGAS